MSHPIGNAAYELVEQLAVKARDKAFWHRPTSLMSKLAFCCDPLIYAPYDRRARTALQARGYTIADHDYCAYMSAFNLEKEHWARALRSEGRTAGPRYLGQQMERGLFEMRAFDKKLMLMGGFDAKRMMKDFDESLFD